MFEIAWEVKELESMNDHKREQMVDFSCLGGKLSQTNYNIVCDNLAKTAVHLQTKAVEIYQAGSEVQMHSCNSHPGGMISPEERNKNPYALPVQCLAYASLGDNKVHRIFDSLAEEVTS